MEVNPPARFIEPEAATFQQEGSKPTPVLSDRERLILQSVVHNFILTADPVGSRSLSRKYNLDLSPATVRNTMADLEEMGLLSHPHTSAGRIPTDLGYRLYVDHIMTVEELPVSERESMRSQFETITAETGSLLEQVSKLLAEVSRMLSVITTPDISSGILDKVELVRVAEGRIMVVVVVSSGVVRTILLEMNSAISDAEIHSAVQIINQRLAGLSLEEVRREISRRLSVEGGSRNAIVRLFMDFPERIFQPETGPEMHLGGRRHVLDQPEYRSPEKLRAIIELLEDSDIIVHVMRERREGITVTIGEEHNRERLNDMSVITSTYRSGGAVGTLGIIGPTRMNYGRLMALVDYTSQLISNRITPQD